MYCSRWCLLPGSFSNPSGSGCSFLPPPRPLLLLLLDPPGKDGCAGPAAFTSGIKTFSFLRLKNDMAACVVVLSVEVVSLESTEDGQERRWSSQAESSAIDGGNSDRRQASHACFHLIREACDIAEHHLAWDCIILHFERLKGG